MSFDTDVEFSPDDGPEELAFKGNKLIRQLKSGIALQAQDITIINRGGTGGGSSGGGSSGVSVVIINQDVYSAIAGDNTIALLNDMGDADYTPIVQAYKEDPVGERNAVAFTLKSWTRNTIKVYVPEVCEIMYLTIKGV